MKPDPIGLLKYGILLTLGLAYGILMHRNELPPYNLLKSAYGALRPAAVETAASRRPLPSVSDAEIRRLLAIDGPGDVARIRTNLVTTLWGGDSLPRGLPARVERDLRDERFADIPSLGRIDRLTVSMGFGLESLAYHFIPVRPNDALVVYHQGHGGDLQHGKPYIRTLLDSGYSVLVFSMPLLGTNNKPSVDLPAFGTIRIASHDQMKLLTPARGHPLKYFIEPVIVGLNYVEGSYDYASVSMIGLSGGAWTTTLAAAVDTRITTIAPVSGSYPLYLRTRRDWGDYEQTEPAVYRVANYLELYVLGSYERGRRQLQVINKYDPCCYGGERWRTYRTIVGEKIEELGEGEFELFVDDSHRAHAISDAAMERILETLAEVPRPDRPRAGTGDEAGARSPGVCGRPEAARHAAREDA